MTLAFVLLSPPVEAIGFPAIAALLIAIVGVLVPFELGVVIWAGRRAGSIGDAIPYRRPMPGLTWAWLVPMLILAAFAGFGIHQVIEPWLIGTAFGWLPQWFVTPIAMDRVADYSSTVWTVTLVAFLAINGLVGPIVEELYFRGYLLPRMEWMGRWAPLVNVSLFSLYHFWSPWQLVARILGFAPDGLRRALEAEHLPWDGRALQPELPVRPHRRQPRLRAPLGDGRRAERPAVAP